MRTLLFLLLSLSAFAAPAAERKFDFTLAKEKLSSNLTEEEAFQIMEGIVWNARDGKNLGAETSEALTLALKQHQSSRVLEDVIATVMAAEERGHSLPNAKELLAHVRKMAPFRGAATVHGLLHLAYSRHPNLSSQSLARPTVPRGIVQVQSTFEDEGKKALRTGTASVVEWRGRTFLLTSAHLVAGMKPGLADGRILDASSLLMDADNDIALAEMPGLLAAFQFRDGDQTLRASDSFQRSLNRGEAALRNIYSRDLTLDSGGGRHTLGQLGFPVVTFSVPAVPWSLENKDGYYGEFSPHGFAPVAELVSAGNQVHFSAHLKAGQSGSPLIQSFGDEEPEIIGILSQSNIYFRDSYFTSIKPIRRLFASYAMGMRGYTSETRWRLKRGLTFRDFGDGTLEASFLEQATGNDLYVDPGNDLYVDPGNDLYVDPGSSSPRAVLGHHGILPGMIYEGKPVIAFLAKSRATPAQIHIIYANPQGYLFLRERSAEYSFSPVPLGADLQPYAWERAKALWASLKNGPPPKRMPLELDRWDRANPPTLAVSPDSLSVGTYFFPRLELDKKGRPDGAAQFSPVIEQKAKNGVFHVDLRRLYFTDLSEVGQSLGKAVPGAASFEEALRLHSLTFGITVRALGTDTIDDHEFFYLPAGCRVEETYRANPNGKYSRPLCGK